MTSNIIQFIPQKDICQECFRAKATRLCDFFIGELGITFHRSHWDYQRQQVGIWTCDKPLCEKCANTFHNMDMCRLHFRKITGSKI